MWRFRLIVLAFSEYINLKEKLVGEKSSNTFFFVAITVATSIHNYVKKIVHLILGNAFF
jgi:hypothetical protein